MCVASLTDVLCIWQCCHSLAKVLQVICHTHSQHLLHKLDSLLLRQLLLLLLPLLLLRCFVAGLPPLHHPTRRAAVPLAAATAAATAVGTPALAAATAAAASIAPTVQDFQDFLVSLKQGKCSFCCRLLIDCLQHQQQQHVWQLRRLDTSY